jgi:hypothetical protein
MLNLVFAVALSVSMSVGHKAITKSEQNQKSVVAWKALPIVKPQGEKQSTGSFTIKDRNRVSWNRPPFAFNAAAATGRKTAKVIVLIYDPPVPSHGGNSLIAAIKGNDPIEYSHILANVIREASWGYLNYEIVDIIKSPTFPIKADGFRYTEESYFAARKDNRWQPTTSSYRGFFTENGLLERVKREKITELWVWGASGMHMDELAMYIPNRYARYGPTDNPWFYRPYDIPEELGRTTWVMGFNYEVGPDNMIHSYVHRIESMAALAFGDGIWDTSAKRDPWNVFSWLEMDHIGAPSMVGNCHVPPNGQNGYDYNNKRTVMSWSDNWRRYPDLRGEPRKVSSQEWGTNQFGYMKWILERVPKFPGFTKFGYNNWWVYIANTDEELPEYRMQNLETFRLPAGFPAPAATKK